MLQGKHPRLFGQAGAIGYAEIWASLGPIAAEVMRGVPASKEDDLFLFETNVPDRPLEVSVVVPVRGERGFADDGRGLCVC